MLAILSLLLCPPPAGTAACVRDLGAYSFRVREAASVRLAALGERAARVALGSRDALEAEQWRALGPMPMVDALWMNTTTMQYTVANRFRERYSGYTDGQRESRYPADPWEWGWLTAATHEIVEDWRAAGVPWWLIRAVLAEMRRRDAGYVERYSSGKWPGRLGWKPSP